ncbi:MAG: hypothetical protein HY903_06215 [Deltaproteobacteria bacterium]|nr:hypothetical protein [Deltaproteobacteria bacterium]
MSESLQELALILAVIYLLEVVSYLPPPRRLFVQGLGRHFRPSASGVVLRNPLPWAQSIASEPPVLRLGTTGVYAYQPHRQSTGRPREWGHRFLRYDAIGALTVAGPELEIDGRCFVQHASEIAARHSAALLDEVRRTPPAERQQVIERLEAATLDVARADARLQTASRELLGLRLLGSLLFADLAGSSILLATTEWALRYWRPGVAACVCLIATVVWRFTVAHRRLYPDAAGDRWLKGFVLAVNFPSACRAAEAVSRDLVAGYHPVVVASLVCDRGGLREVARQTLVELSYPSDDDDVPAEARAVIESARARARAALGALLPALGLSAAELLAPPERHDQSGAGYCPRCGTEFEAVDRPCPDCRVAIVRFPDP